MTNNQRLTGLVLWTFFASYGVASEYVIEEIIVTAQRVEENLQNVPIAASAFTDAMIEDRQIVGLADLQIHVPNVNYADQSLGRGRFNIRGIGRQNDERTTDDGVAVHLNGIPIPAWARLDVLDAERLEVLRGPQGTLYGRNATGGVINIITKQPTIEGTEGFLELEYGDYQHRQLKGALNVPLGDRFAVRFAGMGLKRDGFTENLADGQVAGVDDDLDGRDLWSARATAKWWLNDSLTLTVLYHHFDEDDDRLRNTQYVCSQNPLPTIGCLAGGRGFDVPHPDATDGSLAASLGARALGSRDASTGLSFAFARPELGFRKQHSDLEPIYERDEDFVSATLEWVGEDFALTLSGSYFEEAHRSIQDEYGDVGYTFSDTPRVPSGEWPTSAPSGGIGALRSSTECNVNDATAGVRGGCIWPADLTRSFSYDSTEREVEQAAVELKFNTLWDGPLNFLVGGNYLHRVRATDYYRVSNVFSQTSLVEPPLRLASPGFFHFTINDYDFDSYSAFGELYWQATPSLKFTAGLRYNHDDKSIRDAVVSPFEAFDVGGGSGDPVFIRSALLGWFRNNPNTGLTDLYGATDAALAAAGNPAELTEVLRTIPIAQALGELRDLMDVPDNGTWDAVTARVGATWTPNSDQMLYAFYSRGHKPGGLPRFALPVFDEESVDTIEIGTKNKLRDGTLLANIAIFWNNYDGLQLDAREVDGTATTRNFDASSWGAELDLDWRPRFLPNTEINVTYSWLHTELASETAIDRTDPDQGNPDYVLLRDGPRGSLYIARRAEVLPLVDAAIAAPFPTVPAPNTIYPDGIPALFSRTFLNLNGVETLSGLPVDLKNNEIPNAPEHTVSIGIAYSWYLQSGTIRARGDYYWQSRSFTTAFNGPSDRLDAWDQLNASLTFEAASGRWSIKTWVRNLTDEDNINGHFTTAQNLSGGRNYLINEPRLFGATLRVNFGI